MLLSGMEFNVEECAVSSLTEYEVGNALWKEHKRRRVEDPNLVADVFSEALQEFQKFSIDSFTKVLVVATERNLTFYDASYAYLAEKEDLKLVTEDTDLLKKCKSAITMKDLLKASS